MDDGIARHDTRPLCLRISLTSFCHASLRSSWAHGAATCGIAGKMEWKRLLFCGRPTLFVRLLYTLRNAGNTALVAPTEGGVELYVLVPRPIMSERKVSDL
jgi:hypothetical protein